MLTWASGVGSYTQDEYRIRGKEYLLRPQFLQHSLPCLLLPITQLLPQAKAFMHLYTHTNSSGFELDTYVWDKALVPRYEVIADLRVSNGIYDRW